MENYPIREFVKRFENAEFESSDVKVQCNAGWYDWFCKDSALRIKTMLLGDKLMQIKDSSKIDIDKNYVWFKNNCPCNGSLYDDFRIADLKTGDVIFTITPASGHSIDRGIATVWGKENDFKEPLVKGNWGDVLNFFGTTKSLIYNSLVKKLNDVRSGDKTLFLWYREVIESFLGGWITKAELQELKEKGKVYEQ